MKVPATRQSIGWVESLLLHPDKYEGLAAIKGEAVKAQDVMVKAIEMAITAHQEAVVHHDALVTAWAEHATIDVKAKAAEKAAKKFFDGQKAAQQKWENARDELTRAVEAHETAQVGCSNAGELAEAATKAAEDATMELDRATREFDTAQVAARQDEEAAKKAKKDYDRAVMNVDETKKAQVTGSAYVTRSEERASSKLEKASFQRKSLSEAEQLRDQAIAKLNAAVSIMDDFDGTCNRAQD